MEDASPHIVRATQLPDPDQRGFAFTAVGTAAQLNGALTPELYEVLRAAGPGRKSIAVNAVDDTLTFVPFRDLPPWLKRWAVYATVRDKLEGWWLRGEDAAHRAWQVVRRG